MLLGMALLILLVPYTAHASHSTGLLRGRLSDDGRFSNLTDGNHGTGSSFEDGAKVRWTLPETMTITSYMFHDISANTGLRLRMFTAEGTMVGDFPRDGSAVINTVSIAGVAYVEVHRLPGGGQWATEMEVWGVPTTLLETTFRNWIPVHKDHLNGLTLLLVAIFSLGVFRTVMGR